MFERCTDRQDCVSFSNFLEANVMIMHMYTCTYVADGALAAREHVGAGHEELQVGAPPASGVRRE